MEEADYVHQIQFQHKFIHQEGSAVNRSKVLRLSENMFDGLLNCDNLYIIFIRIATRNKINAFKACKYLLRFHQVILNVPGA